MAHSDRKSAEGQICSKWVWARMRRGSRMMSDRKVRPSIFSRLRVGEPSRELLREGSRWILDFYLTSNAPFVLQQTTPLATPLYPSRKRDAWHAMKFPGPRPVDRGSRAALAPSRPPTSGMGRWGSVYDLSLRVGVYVLEAESYPLARKEDGSGRAGSSAQACSLLESSGRKLSAGYP